MVFEQLHVSRDEAVIDVGCGSGASVVTLSKYAKEVVGIDISGPVVEYLQARPKPDNVKFYAVDVTKDPPREFLDKFDKCLCVDVLEHVENPVKAVEFCQNVLKSQGLLVMTFPINNVRHGTNYFTKETVDDLLKKTDLKADLRLLKLKGFGALVDRLYDYVQRVLAPPREGDRFEDYTCFQMLRKPRRIHFFYRLGISILFGISRNSLYHQDKAGNRVLIIARKG